MVLNHASTENVAGACVDTVVAAVPVLVPFSAAAVLVETTPWAPHVRPVRVARSIPADPASTAMLPPASPNRQ